MGQHLSDLKGYLGVADEMENKTDAEDKDAEKNTERKSECKQTEGERVNSTSASSLSSHPGPSSSSSSSPPQSSIEGVAANIRSDSIKCNSNSEYGVVKYGMSGVPRAGVCECHASSSSENKTSDIMQSANTSSHTTGVEVDNKDSVTTPLRRSSEPTAVVRRSIRSLSFVGRRHRAKSKSPKELLSKKKKNPWPLKLNCKLKGTKSVGTEIPEPNIGCSACVCTGYRRTEEHHLGAGVVFEAATPPHQRHQPTSLISVVACSDSSSDDGFPSGATASLPAPHPVIDLSKFNPEDFPIEDCDERARQERAREIAEGVDPPPGFRPQHFQLLYSPSDFSIEDLTALFQSPLGVQSALSALSQLSGPASVKARPVHTQIDYIHCLVPDLLQITACSFYWGKMDRYEAERLLEGRPEGTFLLRDSAQEEYLFSVSFRKYGRSLHARIEQWNHKFTFDSHDPGVFASDTVCGLIEHYKDPTCCMFFEPMLTIPLHRNFAFPLQHLCRAVICSRTTYDSINQLFLPKTLKSYLKEYHYKQRVRVRRFELEH